MLNRNHLKTLRKYWYIVVLLLVVIACIGAVVGQSGKDPVELLRKWGYLVIVVWTFLEGETIVIIAGAVSKSVGLDPPLIALCAFCGSFLSDQVMFSLGKYKGEDVLKYFPKVASNMTKAAALFKKYDTVLILGFRFVYGVRNITPIMLGISGVSHKKFFFLNAIGAGIWALTFTYGGVLAGEAFSQAMEHLGHGILYILLAILVIVALLWYIRARHNVKRAKDIAGVDASGLNIPGPNAPEASVSVLKNGEAKPQDSPSAGAGTTADPTFDNRKDSHE